MIGLMEKYANNLEILVDERTKQLSEEKRKTGWLHSFICLHILCISEYDIVSDRLAK